MKNGLIHPIGKNFLYICLLALLPFPQCYGQKPDGLTQTEKPKAKIVSFQPIDTFYIEYTFYDTSGNKVKTLRHDEFEARNPVWQLDLPQAPDSLTWMTFDFLVDYSTKEKKVIPKKNAKKILSELMSLKKYGLIVKNPEKAIEISGSPLDRQPYITQPSGKYLTKVENASVLDTYAEETFDVGNALLDCSYISVYNFMGAFVKGILIPDKTVDYAVVSDDGRFMVCICSYSLVWDEGVSDKPEGVYVVDLAGNEMTYIAIPETHGYIEPGSILFADRYFQMSYGYPLNGEAVDRLFINPYSKTYYLKHYATDYMKSRKTIWAKSFTQFEGIQERIEEFSAHPY